jgi:hypothetical protein
MESIAASVNVVVSVYNRLVEAKEAGIRKKQDDKTSHRVWFHGAIVDIFI